MRRSLRLMLLLQIAFAPTLTSSTSAEDAAVESAKGAVIERKDILYGKVDDVELVCDIAYPESTPPLPAIISVHGGRWKAGHKRDKSTIVVRQWAEFGFFAMSIDYRLVGRAPVPACYQDVQCAIRFVHAHAKDYHIDTERIFLMGQSAGGHMVSLAATLGDGPFKRTGGWKDARNDVRAVISVAANYELTTLSWGNIWAPSEGDPTEARRLASPVNHVSRDSTPLLIIHADNDRSVPIDNALLMVETLQKAGAEHRFHRYDDAGHMGITEEVIRRAREFIEQQSGVTAEH